MKISRRNFCLLMAGACCTGVLAACGSGSSSTASSSAASASAAASGEVRDELIFVNYRDIRDLNPHLYAGEIMPRASSTIRWSALRRTVMKAVWQKAGTSARMAAPTPSTFVPMFCSRMAKSVMPMPFLPTSTPFWKTANATLGWK